MKEQTRNTEIQTNEEKIDKLPEEEFRIMIVKMIKNLENKIRENAKMKEQTRNREVQVNEEEIGKLPEKEFRIMTVKMIKNLEKTKWRKCKNQLRPKRIKE